MRAAPVPSGPALGAITSAAIDDEGSNSGWNVVGPSKESRTRGGGRRRRRAARPPRRARARAASAAKTEIGFESTHGTSQPGRRPRRDRRPGPAHSTSIARSASASGAPSRRSVSRVPRGQPAARAQPQPGSRRHDVPHRPGTRAASGLRRSEREPVRGRQRVEADVAAAARQRVARSRGCPPAASPVSGGSSSTWLRASANSDA